MKLFILSSFILFTSLAQARFCTTNETLTCGMTPVCSSVYNITCSDGSSKSFGGLTGPLGWGKGAYPKVKKWAQEQGLTEKTLKNGWIYLYDSSERPDARYCTSRLLNSEKIGINGDKGEMHNIVVECLNDSANTKIYKLVTKEEVNSRLESVGYKNTTPDKSAKIQHYRYAAD